MEIELTDQIVETINRALTLAVHWPVRLVIYVCRYPARRRERKRRREHRKAMDAWADDYIDFRIHGMEKVLMDEPDFLAEIRDALRHTPVKAFQTLIPDFDYHVWTMGKPAKMFRRWMDTANNLMRSRMSRPALMIRPWLDRLKGWWANLNDTAKMMAIAYGFLLGVVVVAIGLVFGIVFVDHLIRHYLATHPAGNYAP